MGNEFLKDISKIMEKKTLSQDDIVKILKDYEKPEGTPAPVEAEPAKPEKPDKPEPSSIDENKEKDKEAQQVDIEELKKTITESLSKNVDDTVQAKLKELTEKLRNAPPTGSESSESTDKDPFVGARPYDTWV